MSTSSNARVIAMAVGIIIVSYPAVAQRRMPCPGHEGRMANGSCVNPNLAASLRERSVQMNQSNINQFISALPPSKDGKYPRGFDVNRFESSQAGTGSTDPFPASP